MLAPALTDTFDRVVTVGQEVLRDSPPPTVHRLITLVGWAMDFQPECCWCNIASCWLSL